MTANTLNNIFNQTARHSFLPSDIYAASSQKTKTISCFHINAQSLRNKGDEFEAFFSTLNFRFNVVMVTETWYQNSCEILQLPNYNTHVQNRNDKRGGGVLIAIEKCFKCSILADFTQIHDDYEVLSLQSGKNVFSVIYRPPKSNFSNFACFLDEYLQWVSDNNLNLVLGGDVNIDFLSHSANKLEVESILQCNGFINVINEPTRLQAATSIDVFFTNSPADHLKSGIINVHISDHLPIYLIVECETSRKQCVPSAIEYRRINNETLNFFRGALANVDWNVVRNKNAPEDAYNAFIAIFRTIYEQSFPFVAFKKPRKARKPWITAECLKMIKKKTHLYNRFIQTKLPDDLVRFKTYRNQVTSTLRQAKNSTWKNYSTKTY